MEMGHPVNMAKSYRALSTAERDAVCVRAARHAFGIMTTDWQALGAVLGNSVTMWAVKTTEITGDATAGAAGGAGVRGGLGLDGAGVGATPTGGDAGYDSAATGGHSGPGRRRRVDLSTFFDGTRSFRHTTTTVKIDGNGAFVDVTQRELVDHQATAPEPTCSIM